MIDGAEEYRAEPGSVKNAGSQTNTIPVNSGQRSWLKSWRVHVKDRLQVAICEPVEVDDDGHIFGRQRINRSHLHEINIASYSIQTSPARIAWLEPSLD